MANVTHYIGNNPSSNYNYTMYVGETLNIETTGSSYSQPNLDYDKGIIRIGEYISDSIPGVNEYYWSYGQIKQMTGTPTKAGIYTLYASCFIYDRPNDTTILLPYRFESFYPGVGTITITVLPVNPVIKVNVGGTWKDSTPKVKVSGEWKDVTKAFMKVNGTWKEHV